MGPYKIHRFFYLLIMDTIVVAGALGVTFNNAPSVQAVNLASANSPSVVDVPQLYSNPIALGSGIQAVANAAPTLADLNGDSKLDIIVGTRNGWVVAISGSNGSILWKQNILQYGFETSTCGTDLPISSSPAVGYLRKGVQTPLLAVVIGVGGITSVNGNGGVIAFDKVGNWLWTRLTYDRNGDGCTDGVVASPTIVDVDKAGRDEVLYGAFDQRFYMLNDDGTDFTGWPLEYRDTIWSSPVVGDIDGDGQNDIVIASDAGQTTQTCPYPLPWSYNYCGGEIDVRRLNGTEKPGFPYRTWQAIQSQPALADLNGDGRLDIVVGSGTFYDTADSFLVYALDYTGSLLPGWPVNLQGATDGEPGVGDLNGDGKLEVVMGTGDYYASSAGWKLSPHAGYLQAIWSDGNNHPGGPFMWQFQPRDTNFNGWGPIRAPMIADMNNDGHLDVVYSFSWEVQVVDGRTGQALIGGYQAANNLRMYTNHYSIMGPVAIGDVKGDGHLEIVAGSAVDNNGNTGAVYVWDPRTSLSIPAGTPAMPWPMFRQDANHTGQYALSSLEGGPNNITQLDVPGGISGYTYTFAVKNLGDEPLRFLAGYSVNSTCGTFTVQPSSQITLNSNQSQNVTVTLNLAGCNTLGTYNLGTITMTGTYGSASAPIQALNSPRTIPVRALIVSTIYRSSLPLILR
jgi:hypothetical protein